MPRFITIYIIFNLTIKYYINNYSSPYYWWYRCPCVIELNDGPPSGTFLHYYPTTGLADDRKAALSHIGLNSKIKYKIYNEDELSKWWWLRSRGYFDIPSGTNETNDNTFCDLTPASSLNQVDPAGCDFGLRITRLNI